MISSLLVVATAIVAGLLLVDTLSEIESSSIDGSILSTLFLLFLLFLTSLMLPFPPLLPASGSRCRFLTTAIGLISSSDCRQRKSLGLDTALNFLMNVILLCVPHVVS